ncbi:MAG: trypsin-like peptidase domain-containing protein, partial [Acidimicrobiia bacterium]
MSLNKVLRKLSMLSLLVAGVVVGVVLSGRVTEQPDVMARTTPTSATASAAAEEPAQQQAVAAGPDFTRVAAQTTRAVTNISSVQVSRRAASPFANDPFFQYFFGDQADVFGRNRAQQSLGSGVVVSADGYVVTNIHVIGDDVAEVTVTVGVLRDVKARVIGVDSWTDLGLLKIDAKALPVIPWGDSSKLQVAEWVMAVGTPFSLTQTGTLGMVTALGRAH